MCRSLCRWCIRQPKNTSFSIRCHNNMFATADIDWMTRICAIFAGQVETRVFQPAPMCFNQPRLTSSPVLAFILDENVQEKDWSRENAWGRNGESSGGGRWREIMSSSRAGPRTERGKSNIRRKRKSQVLTSTPVKNALIEEKSARSGQQKIKKPSATVSKSKKRRSQKTARKLALNDKRASREKEDEDYDCCICGEPYSNSRSGETWIQCMVETCDSWAHEQCGDGTSIGLFICPTCEDDD